jgi:transposase
MNQLSSRVYQNALIDLKDAFSRYRSGVSGHPRFASRRNGQSFRVDSSNGKVLLSAGKGMMANHKLAGAISDLGFYEFKRQLDYKCKMYGSKLVLVDQWFPSSKICSNCGNKKDMPLSVRTYDCPACGISIDRDLNASINILNWEPSA